MGDPVAEKRRSPVPTFQEAARRVHEANLPRWRNEKHTLSWMNTLERHAFSVLGNLRVDRIGQADVLKVLTPVWNTGPETARRVRQRIRTVMRWAMAHGFIENNPAGEAIDGALPPTPKLKAHLRALPKPESAEPNGGGTGAGHNRDGDGIVQSDFGWTRARVVGRLPAPRSGRERQGAQSSQGATELVFPGPALGKMRGEAARRAGEASGEGEEAPSEGLGGYDLLAQADARGPAGQVMSDDLHRQPGGVGGETSRWQVVETDAVLEVSDGILDLGVAVIDMPEVGFQFQGVPVPVGDEGVIAVVAKRAQLGVGRGL